MNNIWSLEVDWTNQPSHKWKEVTWNEIFFCRRDATLMRCALLTSIITQESVPFNSKSITFIYIILYYFYLYYIIFMFKQMSSYPSIVRAFITFIYIIILFLCLNKCLQNFFLQTRCYLDALGGCEIGVWTGLIAVSTCSRESNLACRKGEYFPA